MKDAKTPTFIQVIWSVIAAMFGVQKNERRIRDFTYGNPKVFIAVGLLLAALFFITVFVVVKIVLHFALH